MANYQEARVKLTNTHKIGTILRFNKKNFEDKELPNGLFITTRQTTKIRHTLANNISIDIKLSKVHISKIIQSVGSFGFWLGDLGKKALKDFTIPLARDNLPGLVNSLTSNAMNKISKKYLENELSEQKKDFIYSYRMKI